MVSLEHSAGKGPVNKSPVKRGARYLYHRVRRGDTLYTIAWRYGLDYPVLAKWNGIRYPYTIYPGQRVRLTRPAGSRSSAKKGVVPKARTRAAKPPASAGKRAAKKNNQGKPAYSTRRKLHWRWPTKGKLVQSYSSRDPARKGIKIGGRRGQRVVAAESGKVVYAGSGLIGYGRLIIIKHNKNYLSAYGHNRKLLVKEGKVVKKGEPVAEMGEQGGGRPRLHFEIRKNGTPVNPIKLLPRRS